MKTWIKPLMLTAFVLSGCMGAYAQEEIDGKWHDENLTFKVVKESLRLNGKIQVCIYSTEREHCIDNLFTSFEILVYDQSGKEIWNSLWRGENMDLQFKKPLPEADHIIIRATNSFVINALTGTRIHQSEPIELKHRLE